MALLSRTKPRPAGCSLAEFGTLSVAEQALLSSCQVGELAIVADERPTEETNANRVRAAFLRFLALGGDDNAPVHEHGVQIQGAWLTGPLDLGAALIECRLSIWNCRIEKVEATQCRIQFMNLSGCRIEDGFRADRIQSESGLFLRNGFHVSGETRLLGATIGGDFDCSGGRFENPGGDALSVDRAKISGGVFLNNDFHAVGAVRMLGTTIAGNLECGKASFESPGNRALAFDGAEISGAVYLDRGFSASGEVSLMDTVIGKSVECRNARLDNGTDDAFSADRSTISGRLFMGGAFVAIGAVRLHGTTIGGNLSCDGGHFTCVDKVAMVWDAIKVRGDMSLVDAVVTGELRAVGATIGGDLQCHRATFTNPNDDALCFERASVGGGFFFRQLRQIDGSENLSSMHVINLCDDNASWALASGRIVLDGFVFDRLVGKAPTDSRSRIAWLDRQRADHLTKEFRPQPWEQLIGVLRAMGHPNEARRVAVAKQQRLRRARRIIWGAWPFHVI